MVRRLKRLFSPTHKMTLFAAALSALSVTTPVAAQMVTGRDMTDFNKAFGLDKNAPGDFYSAKLVKSDAPGNILWPGDKPSFTFQITNNRSQPMTVAGRVQVIAYGTKGKPGDIWVPTVVKFGDVDSVPVSVKLDGKATTEITVTPRIPEKLGGYALVLDLGPEYGRRFLISCARTFKASGKRVQYPSLSLDNLGPTVLSRLDVHAIRHGIAYKPTTDKNFDEWYQNEAKKIRELHAAGVTVLAMFGGGDFHHPNQPLGRPRPWLDEKGVMLDTKFDLAWLPEYDADFRKFVRKFTSELGWPKGPITAVSLWNEPWEGISISGWGADMPRYREIYTAMAEGTEDARKEAGVEVLIGGGDSSSNALDKFFGDGSDAMLPQFDFLSVHYQGMAAFSTYKPWVNRKNPLGRVRIWDTESWVANTDDRVATVIATNRSTGYDRAMGVFGGNIHEADEHGPGGANAWSTAAAVGAAVHFIGERPFREILFKNGLPWVTIFDGVENAEDGTVVVVGDIGESFGPNNVLFRTARGMVETNRKEAIRKALASLTPEQANAPANPNEGKGDVKPGEGKGDVKPGEGKGLTRREALQAALDAEETLTEARLTIRNRGGAVKLYDFYGNPVESKGDTIVVPLDGRGFFLRGNGKPGSFAKVVDAVRNGRVDGIEPLATVAHDLLTPVDKKPTLRLTLTNVLNRPVSGSLSVKLGDLTLDKTAQTLTFAPHETKTVALTVTGGKAVDSNTYPLALRFDAGKDGYAVHYEELHVNQIARRTITVDGKLDEWAGVLPQTVVSGETKPSVTEAAWFPFKKFDAGTGKGLATAFLAYDDDNFYFATKVADTTPDGGTLRFETRDDDQFYYPEKSYAPARSEDGFSVRWTGFLTVPKTGEYTLSTFSDDGVRLFVDNKAVVDNWNDHGGTEDKATVTLEAGKKYPVRLEFYQGGGDAVIKLSWEAAGLEKQIIPTSALTADDGKTPGLTGTYFLGRNLGQKVTQRIDTSVNYAFSGGQFPDPAYKTTERKMEELVWPAGVRRYSYRKDPILPAGNFPNFDNVQIAFNVLPPDKKRFLPNPPGTMPNYTVTHDMDYEYALNKVAEQYGGGTEIWRLCTPEMPLKHYYPRQGKSPADGPVKSGKLVVTHEEGTRLVECAIPWSEIPEVKKRMDAGETIRFSFRVNDNAGVGCMELSRGRSVAKRGNSFHVDWQEHWENQVEFAAEKK